MILDALGGRESIAAVERSRSLSSYALAVPLVIAAWVTVRSTRGLDRPFAGDAAGATPHTSLRSLFIAQLGIMRHRIFAPLLLAFIVSGVGRAVYASIALYYYELRIGLTEPATVLHVLPPFFLCVLVSVPMWVLISRRAGKKWPAFWGIFGLGLLVSIAYPMLPPGTIVWPVLVAVFGGLLAGSVILYESIVADVVDVDELETGRNREGLYFGVWRMGTKLSRAFGIAAAGVLLGMTGFDESAPVQAEGVARHLGLLFGPGVGVFLVLGAGLFALMPFSDREHRRVQGALAARRGGSPGRS